jgi:hypothetical protein
MKIHKMIIVAAAVMAFAPAARAGQMDFDGACGGKAAGLGDSLARVAVPESPAPQSPASCGAAAGPVLDVKVEKNATSKKTFSADGAQAKVPSVKYVLSVKSAGTDSQWAVGDNDKIYSLGASRQAPEFAAVRKLADALSLLGNPGATRGKKCQTDKSFVCIDGQTNECKVDQCGWCGKWEDGTWGCEWETTSAPYACRPNGYRCN